ncbi:MAG: hypothetical protein SGPRY_006739 [Prymnesium sp.]
MPAAVSLASEQIRSSPDFQDARCLLNAEVAHILEIKLQSSAQHSQQKSDFLKAYEYVNRVKMFRDQEAVQRVRAELEKKKEYHDYERVQVPTTQPSRVAACGTVMRMPYSTRFMAVCAQACRMPISLKIKLLLAYNTLTLARSWVICARTMQMRQKSSYHPYKCLIAILSLGRYQNCSTQ